MVNQDPIPQDGFRELLQTQLHTDIAPHLEMAIMETIERVPTKNASPVNISAIFVFGLLVFLYVLVAVISHYIYPNLPSLNDFKLLLGLGILIQVLYEANELLPRLLEKFTHHRIAKL